MQNPQCIRCRDDGIYVPEDGRPYRVCSCSAGNAYLDEMKRAGGSVMPERIDATPKQTIN